jgi:hypothetical protein
MRTSVERFLFLSLSTALLWSCTRAPETAHITVKFPAATAANSTASSSLQVLSVGTGPSKWQLPLPTAKTEINCYALAVALSENTVHSIACDDNTGYIGSTDYMFGGFPADTVATVDVPTGPARKFYLLGFKTDDITLCKTIPETGGIFPLSNFSPPVVLQGLTKDIMPDADFVEFTVPVSLTTATTFEDCLPKSFAP